MRVYAFVSFVGVTIAQEHTSGCVELQFVLIIGLETGIASTPKGF